MKIKKSTNDRLLAGVMSGIAKATGANATLLRLGAVVLTMLTGPLAVIGYILASVLMEDDEPKPLND